MKFFYGLAGAILGGLFGAAIPISVATIFDSGNSSVGLILLLLVPLGFLIGGGFGIDVWLRSLHYLRQPIEEQSGWTQRKILLVMLLYLGIPMVSIGMVAASDTYRSTPPSDAAMIENFHRHQATFDTLVTMARQDKKLKSVDKEPAESDVSEPEDFESLGASPKRIAEYRRLFAVAGVTQESWGLSDGNTDFTYWNAGSLPVSDASKSYVYLPQPPNEVQTCLDGYVPKHLAPETSYFAYRHFEGNWYLEYDCEHE